MSERPDTFQLPPLQQTLLDPATLRALFLDLTACAQILSVSPKPATRPAQAPTSNASITLDAARAGLADGTLRGAQIRYRYEQRMWCDTLMARPEGIRLVRICEDDIAATLAPASATP